MPRAPPSSLLLLGRPGSGKTTLLRDTARLLADELGLAVVVVDTSNEIAGALSSPVRHARDPLPFGGPRHSCTRIA